jgi:hypothetical protein
MRSEISGYNGRGLRLRKSLEEKFRGLQSRQCMPQVPLPYQPCNLHENATDSRLCEHYASPMGIYPAEVKVSRSCRLCYLVSYYYGSVCYWGSSRV